MTRVLGRAVDLDFEYLITDEDASFGVVDTHHNVLIRLGSMRV